MFPANDDARREHLRSWREQHGLSQRAIAEVFGVHSRTIGHWERGENITPHWVPFALDGLRLAYFSDPVQ